MRKGIIGLVLIGMIVSGCSCQERRDSAAVVSNSSVSIHRFDKALYQYACSEDSLTTVFPEEYKGMLDLIGQAVLNIKSSDDEALWPEVRRYYSEPTLRKLYQDAIRTYDSIPRLEEKLTAGFAFLKREFPGMRIPKVYMHVSGFNQNVLVTDSLLSLSIDKYLGADYPLYKEFFYPDQRRRMSPMFVPQDYLRGWVMAEYPFDGNPDVLLDRMVYEGKLVCLVADALNLNPAKIMGYMKAEEDWCEQNEEMVWRSIIERKRLYTPDRLMTATYFDGTFNRPFAEQGAPSLLGAWLGWRIVKLYMEETGCSYAELFAEKDAQRILTLSKYKPF